MHAGHVKSKKSSVGESGLENQWYQTLRRTIWYDEIPSTILKERFCPSLEILLTGYY